MNNMDSLKKVIVSLTLLLTLGALPVASATAGQNTATQTAATLKDININSASAEEIAAALKGVGIKRAKSVVAWREINGDFTHLEQLLDIRGIGKKILEKNKARITLE